LFDLFRTNKLDNTPARCLALKSNECIHLLTQKLHLKKLDFVCEHGLGFQIVKTILAANTTTKTHIFHSRSRNIQRFRLLASPSRNMKKNQNSPSLFSSLFCAHLFLKEITFFLRLLDGVVMV